MSKLYDTLIGEYIKNPGKRGLGLDRLGEVYFDYKMISYDDLTNKGKTNFKDLDLKKASIYSGEDVYITHKIYEKQKKDDSIGRVFSDIEMPLLEVLKDMEISGVKIDRDKLKGIGILLENEMRTLEKDIYNDADSEFNINSPKQVGEILFGKLALPKGKKTKTGFSVSAEVLGELAFEYPIAQKIVDYRRYSKLLSTYVEGLSSILKSDSKHEDMAHTSYNQTIAATGRLSSTDPNLQNIPVGDGISGEIREAFISRFKSGKIIAFDYSQVEVRILAMMSGDQNLIKAFKENIDIHHKTAEFIFGKSQISSSERKIAKAVNFGVIYGISSFGLTKMLGIPMKDSKNYIDRFFENYKAVKDYLEETIKFCEKNSYVETLFGRRRYISSINDKNSIIKKAAEREAINMPIQGTSADIIKIAMIEVSKFLKENTLKSILIMQVHDELVFDVYPGEEDVLEVGVKNIMENVLNKQKDIGDKIELIDLKVDVGIGKNWKEAK